MSNITDAVRAAIADGQTPVSILDEVARAIFHPDPSPVACNCEHVSHENGEAHSYMGVPAGEQRAQHVGLVCDECATGHMAIYIEAPCRETDACCCAACMS